MVKSYGSVSFSLVLVPQESSPHNGAKHPLLDATPSKVCACEGVRVCLCAPADHKPPPPHTSHNRTVAGSVASLLFYAPTDQYVRAPVCVCMFLRNREHFCFPLCATIPPASTPSSFVNSASSLTHSARRKDARFPVRLDPNPKWTFRVWGKQSLGSAACLSLHPPIPIPFAPPNLAPHSVVKRIWPSAKLVWDWIGSFGGGQKGDPVDWSTRGILCIMAFITHSHLIPWAGFTQPMLTLLGM